MHRVRCFLITLCVAVAGLLFCSRSWGQRMPTGPSASTHKAPIAFRGHRWGDLRSTFQNLKLQFHNNDTKVALYRDESETRSIVWTSKPELRALSVDYRFDKQMLSGVKLWFEESRETELKAFLTALHGEPASTQVAGTDKTWIWRRIGGGTKEVHLESGNVPLGAPSGLRMWIYDVPAFSRHLEAKKAEEQRRKLEAEQAQQKRDEEALIAARRRAEEVRLAQQRDDQQSKTTTWGVAATLLGAYAKGRGYWSLERQQAEYDLVEYLVLDRYTDRLPVSLDTHFSPSPDETSVVLDLVEAEKAHSPANE